MDKVTQGRGNCFFMLSDSTMEWALVYGEGIASEYSWNFVSELQQLCPKLKLSTVRWARYYFVHAYDEHSYPIGCSAILPYPCEVCLAIALFKVREIHF